VLIEEGDLILLYTDGLVENTSPSGESVPLRSVLNSLNTQKHPQELVSEIVGQANTVWAGYPAADDVSLLAIRWTATSP
jgi:serine phosphatase RsbU (regulator of sigma subunit)